MKSAAALAVLVSLLPAYVAAQSNEWAQCGGITYSGPTVCVAGTVCVKQNDYFSHCLPVPPDSASSSSPASSTA